MGTLVRNGLKYFFIDFYLVYISIGIMCTHHVSHINDTIHALTSLTSIFQKHKRTQSFKIVIGLLSKTEKDINMVNEKVKQYEDLKDADIFTLTSKDSQAIVKNQHELNLATGNHLHKEYVIRRADLNILISKLFWKCSQYSDLFLWTDANLRFNPSLVQDFHNALMKFDDYVDMFTYSLTSNHFAGKVYNSKNAKPLIEYLYWMALHHGPVKLIAEYEQFLSKKAFAVTTKPLFSEIGSSRSHFENPHAYIASTLHNHKYFHPFNAYENTGIFWSETTQTKDHKIEFKFFHPIKIKHILIDTGINIYMMDMIMVAVLEESLHVDASGQCKNFNKIADFRSGVIDIDLLHYRKHISCLRIRFFDNENHWVAIKRIEITI